MYYYDEQISQRSYKILKIILGAVALILGLYFLHSVLSSYFKFNNIKISFNQSFIWFVLFCCSVVIISIMSIFILFIFRTLSADIDKTSLNMNIKNIKEAGASVKSQFKSPSIKEENFANVAIEEKKKKKFKWT